MRDLLQGLAVHRFRGGRCWGANEVLYAFGLLPCYFLNWAWTVVRHGRDVIDERGVIFAVYPVFSDLVVGWHLSRRHGFPLVLDFRDDFSGVMSRGWRRLFGPLYRWYEARLLQSAARVTVTTALLKRDLVARHGLDESRVSVVHNIVPRAKAGTRRADSGGSRVVSVVYAGAISAIQRPEILLKAYRKLAASKPDLATRVQVEFFGPESPYFRLRVRQHFGEGCHFRGFLPHDELVARLVEADIGFLSLADSTFAYATPTKLFEYVELGIPVLAVLPCGAARQMIEEYDIGAAVDPDDVDALASQLQVMVECKELRDRFRRGAARMREENPPEREVEKWRDAITAAGGEL